MAWSQLVRVQRANGDPFRPRAAELLAQRPASLERGAPVFWIPDRLIADTEVVPADGLVETRFRGETGHALACGAGGGEERMRDFPKAIVGRDRRSCDHPCLADVHVSDAGVLAVEPV